MKVRRPSMEPNLDPPFRLRALSRPYRPQHFLMAAQRMQTRKRRRAEQAEHQDPQPELQHPPPKRVKSSAKPNFPPEFWDSLSKVSATHRALRELDRRNNARPAPKPPLPAVHPTDLERFARRGGPDLRHLRGCPLPRADVDRPKMSSNRRSSSSSSRRAASESTGATTEAAAPPRVKRSSAYDANFGRHMSDHGIHLPFKHRGPKPNTAEIRRQFSARRPSLSPSRFDDTAFDDFVLISKSVSESSVMAKVIPILAGNANIPNEHNLKFTNCATLTGDFSVNPAPDFFDGAPPGALHKSLRDDLDRVVVPTKHGNGPVAPNFFLEGKSQNGSPLIACRQACLDGAYGARAMHSLQNYREEVPTYTAEVHAYSSTYWAGQLKLFSHQVTAPTESGGEPEYYMTQISCYALTDDRSAFAAGATAFRNARDLAQRHRDELIQSANAKARRANPPLFDDEPAAVGD